MEKSKIKKIIITNIISPYQVPLFNYLHKQEKYDFQIVGLAENEENRDWLMDKKKKKYILWNKTTLLSTGKTDGLIGRMKRIIINGAD